MGFSLTAGSAERGWRGSFREPVLCLSSQGSGAGGAAGPRDRGVAPEKPLPPGQTEDHGAFPVVLT